MLLTDNQLLEKRNHADPVADEVVAAIMEQGNSEAISDLFNALTKNVDVPKSLLPDIAIEYFKNTKELPPYYDEELVNRAQKVFGIYGPEISMILLCKSLPQCYACAKGAKVLYHSGRFVQDKDDDNYELLTKRLMETAQFVMNILSPGSFEPDGNAIITTQKVRLIHAAIRFFIHKSGHWDVEQYGQPINQEDMAGTLMSFSALVLEGLQQLGIELSEEDMDAFSHIWRVVGHIIGLDADLIPETTEEAHTLGYRIFDQQLAPSKEGVALTKSAIGFMEHVTPGNLFDSIPSALVHYFLGDKVAKVVEVDPPEGFLSKMVPDLMVHFFDKYDELEDRSAILRKITYKFNRAMLRGLLTYFNKGKRVTFDIPPSLQEDWALKENWDNVWSSKAVLGVRVAFQKSK